jgi:hypothetical protein
VIGTYRFYQNGELIAEKQNLITDSGKRVILRYLSGQTTVLAKSLAVGTSSVAAAGTDAKLSFEVSRADVNVTSPDYINQKVIFKATLPQSDEYAIWEVGALTTGEQDVLGKMLLTFDSGAEPWSVGTFQSDVNRIGGDALRVNAALSTTTTSTLTDILLDVNEFSDTDKFTLAYAPVDANLQTLKIRLKSDASNYYEYTFTGTTAGYKIESWTRAQMTKTGSPSWASIVSADVIVTAKAAGATNVDFDGLRIDEVTGLGLDTPLVSRTVLGAAVVKTDAAEMDIEYTLDVTI